MASPFLTFEDVAADPAPAAVWPTSFQSHVGLVGAINITIDLSAGGTPLYMASQLDVDVQVTGVLTYPMTSGLYGDIELDVEIELVGIEITGEVALVGSMPIDLTLGQGTIDENPLDNAVLTMVVPTQEASTGVSVVRWTLFDGDVTYTYEINPRTMDSPWADVPVSASSTTAGTVLLTEGTFQPALLKAEGAILTKEHYDALVEWKKKRRRVLLTDHFYRQMTVFITSFKPVPRRDLNRPWKHDYEMSFLVITEPVLVAP